MREANDDHLHTLATALEGVEKLLLISSTDVSGRLRQHRAVIDAAHRAGVSLLAYTSMLQAAASSAILAIKHRRQKRP